MLFLFQFFVMSNAVEKRTRSVPDGSWDLKWKCVLCFFVKTQISVYFKYKTYINTGRRNLVQNRVDIHTGLAFALYFLEARTQNRFLVKIKKTIIVNFTTKKNQPLCVSSPHTLPMQ